MVEFYQDKFRSMLNIWLFWGILGFIGISACCQYIAARNVANLKEIEEGEEKKEEES